MSVPRGSRDFRSGASTAGTFGASGVVVFVSAVAGAAVFGDCGAACVDAPSTSSASDFWTNASPMGAVPESPEESFDASCGSGGLAPFVLVSGTTVFEDCGAACVDAPSAFSTFTFGFLVIASTLGAAAEDPE